MLIGYARVSTLEQNLDMQFDALNRFGVDRIFHEKASGSMDDRPVLEKVLEYARSGDTIVVWKLDRIGRSTKHLLNVVSRIQDAGVDFVSLSESINTKSPSGRLVFTVFAAIAEFERDMIRERTKAGLASARARGRKGGRPPADEESITLALDMHRSGAFTIPQIVKATGISKSTLYRYAGADGTSELVRTDGADNLE